MLTNTAAASTKANAAAAMMVEQCSFSSSTSMEPPPTCHYGFPLASSPWEDEALTRAISVCISSPDDLHPTPSPQRPRNSPAFPPPPPPSGRVAKRKRNRASRRSATTFIAADPANFREMVQQVTGIGVTTPVPKEDVTTPGSLRPATVAEGFLPTLDTSAYLLGREATGSAAESGAAETKETLPWFPTLESWGLM